MKPKYRPLVSALWLFAILALVISACAFGQNSNAPPADNEPAPQNNAPAEEEPAAPANNAEPEEEEPPAEEPPPDEEPPPEEEPEEPAYASVFMSLNEAPPPDPIPVEIPTEDGRVLDGIYYPGAYNPGPVIVLMHWAGGDMHDWDAIAPWLQNRGLPPQGTGDAPWLDPSWFPPLPEWASFSVLVFNFGGFGNSPEGELHLDAKAAVVWASMQDNVNPHLITTLGASIGADGCADGCYLHQIDDSTRGYCLGSFSLSPGDYLSSWGNYPYTYLETIEGLVTSDEAMKTAYCLAAENDYDSPTTCRGPLGISEQYLVFIYPEDQHGMRLVDPTLTPSDPATDLNALDLYLLFLQDVYGLDFEE